MVGFEHDPGSLEDLHRHLKEELARNPFLGGAGGRSRRALALTAAPGILGVDPDSAPSEVWSVVIDTLYPTGPVSLVVARADLPSLVFARGITRQGSGDPIGRAGLDLLESAATFAEGMPTVDAAPMPPAGSVAIHIRTSRGIHRVEATEVELVAGGHDLSPLHRAGLRLMADILESEPT